MEQLVMVIAFYGLFVAVVFVVGMALDSPTWKPRLELVWYSFLGLLLIYLFVVVPLGGMAGW